MYQVFQKNIHVVKGISLSEKKKQNFELFLKFEII